MKVKLLSHVRLVATPWTAAYQAAPSMGFSKSSLEWGGVEWGATAFSSLMGSQKVRHDLATEQHRSCAKSLSHVQHFVTLGSSVHETLQARILE